MDIKSMFDNIINPKAETSKRLHLTLNDEGILSGKFLDEFLTKRVLLALAGDSLIMTVVDEENEDEVAFAKAQKKNGAVYGKITIGSRVGGMKSIYRLLSTSDTVDVDIQKAKEHEYIEFETSKHDKFDIYYMTPVLKTKESENKK